MRPAFQFKTLAVAITSLSAASFAGAAGLDRSGQDVTAFFQDGLYAEAAYTYIDADVSGYDNSYLGVADLDEYEKGNNTGDIAESYDFFRFAVKEDINDTFSVGILYDEPFGAAAKYTGDSNFVSADVTPDQVIAGLTGGQFTSIAVSQGAAEQLLATATSLGQQAAAAAAAGDAAAAAELAEQATAVGDQARTLVSANAIAGGIGASAGEQTNVEVRSENVTGLLGMRLGENKNFQIFGGPAAQRLTGDVKLRGPAYLTSAGYTGRISPDIDYGWVAGLAYYKPEIALKAALTYRSEIEHKTHMSETMPSIDYLPESYQALYQQYAEENGAGKIELTMPESVNLDFQTGINPTTLLTAKVRWVPWSDFDITPPVYNASSKLSYPDGLALADYDDDQWSAELGLAKRVHPKLAISGTVGWDSGAGNPITSLGPIEGYYSAGLGAKYNVTENWAVSAGGKYLWFGDAKGALPNDKIVSDFDDNDGFIVGVKLSYQDVD